MEEKKTLFPKVEESIIKEAQFDPKAIESAPKPQSKFKNPKIIVAVIVIVIILFGIFLISS